MSGWSLFNDDSNRMKTGETMDSRQVKKKLYELGADLCGIANINRFESAPEGYNPLDVMPSCRSVISFACRFPAGTLVCKSPVPYRKAFPSYYT